MIRFVDEMSSWSSPHDLTGLVHHAHHGSQYLSLRYSARLADMGIRASTGSVGDSYDNALAETINGLFKTELIKPRKSWRTVEEVELATLEWVWWFNHQRLHAELGYRTPAEAEAAHYAPTDRPRTPTGTLANR